MASDKRVEDRRLEVSGLARRKRLHRVAIGDEARALIERVGVLEQLRGGIQIATLARRRAASRPATLDGLLSSLNLGWRLDPGGKRVAPRGQRDAPVRDRAVGVRAEHGLEALGRLAELERVQLRQRALE